MSTVEYVIERNDTKIDKYTNLLYNQKQLVLSSKNIIRKKRSPLARKINNSDVNSIIKAAKDRVYGSISKEKRDKLCRLFCEMKAKFNGIVKGEYIREIVVWAITGILGLFDAASGLITSLLWIIRQKLYHVICKCKLNGDCLNGKYLNGCGKAQ
jgi:hypothetical protein